MPEIASSWVSILPSAKGFGKKLDSEVGGQLKGSGKRLGSSFGKAFAVAGAAAVAAGGLFLKSAISEAANLEQSVGAINTVFKGSSKQMLGWSRQAAVSVGLTQNEFNELGTLIGSQLKNGGTAMDQLAPKTNNLIKLGADLSSMFGGTTKDAVGALSSALKGERDPIERYGVTLNQAKIDAEAAALGFEKVGTAWSSQATQAATLSLITKQTADAQGNFAKESDTLAHKQQVLAAKFGNLKATIGTALLPVIVRFLNIMENRVGPMLEDVVKAVRPVVESLGDKLAPAFKAVMRFAKANPAVVKGFAIALGVLAAAIGVVTLATAAFSVALQTTGIPLVIIGIAALVAGLIYAYQHSAKFREIVASLGRVMRDFGAWMRDVVLPAVTKLANKVKDNLQPVFAALATFFTGSVLPVLADLAKKFEEWWPSIKKVLAWAGALIAKWAEFYSWAVGKVAPVILKIAGFLLRTLVPAIATVIGWIVKVVGKMAAFGTAMVNGGRKVADFARGVRTKIGEVATYFTKLPGRIVKALGDVGKLLYEAGKDLIRGMINGIKAMAKSLAGAAKDAVGGAIDGAKNLLKIGSPSKVFHEIGVWTMQGLERGLNDGAPGVYDRVSQVARSVAATRVAPPSLATSAGNLSSSPAPAPTSQADLLAMLERIKLDITVGASRDTKARWLQEGSEALAQRA